MSEQNRSLANYGGTGQSTFEGVDERVLEDRDDCEQCPDDPDALPCWWHFLAEQMGQEHAAGRRAELRRADR